MEGSEDGGEASSSQKIDTDVENKKNRLLEVISSGVPERFKDELNQLTTVDDSNAKPKLIEVDEEEIDRLDILFHPEKVNTAEEYRAVYDAGKLNTKSKAGKLQDIVDKMELAPISKKIRTLFREFTASSPGDLYQIGLEEDSKEERAKLNAEFETVMMYQESLLERMSTLSDMYKGKEIQEDDPNYISFLAANDQYEKNKVRLDQLANKYPVATFFNEYKKLDQQRYDQWYKGLSGSGKSIVNISGALTNATKGGAEDVVDIVVGLMGIGDENIVESYYEQKSLESGNAKTTSLQKRPVKEKVLEYGDYKLGVDDGEIVAIYDKDGYDANLSAEETQVLLEKIYSEKIDLSQAEEGYIKGSFLNNGINLMADMMLTMGYTKLAMKGLKMGARKSIVAATTAQYTNDYMEQGIQGGIDGQFALLYGATHGMLSGLISAAVPVEAGINKIPFLPKAKIPLSVKSITKGSLSTAEKLKLATNATLGGAKALFAETLEEIIDEVSAVKMDALLNSQFDQLSLEEDVDYLTTAYLSIFGAAAPSILNTVADVTALRDDRDYKQMLLTAVKNKEEYNKIVDQAYPNDLEKRNKAKNVIAGIVNGNEELFESSSVPEAQKLDFAFNQQIINKATEKEYSDEDVEMAQFENELIKKFYEANKSAELEKKHKQTGKYEDLETQTTKPGESTSDGQSKKSDTVQKQQKDSKPKVKVSLENMRTAEQVTADVETEVKKEEGDVDIQRINPKDLSTDPQRFQPREGGKLNQEKLKKIADNWDDTKQDPVEYWVDPKDGKKYILAGHHRHEGSLMADRSNIKAIEFKGTESEAIQRARESNFRTAQQTVFDNASMLRQYREEKNTQGADQLKTDLGRNARYTENVSHLNPDGKMMDAMRVTYKNKDRASQNKMETISDWIGEARKKFGKVLTNQHENEMYDFLKENQQAVKTKKEFIEKVGQITNTLDWNPEYSVLNLKRLLYKSDAEKTYDEIANDIKKEIKERQKKVDELTSRLNNPNDPKFLNPDLPDFNEMKSNLDNLRSKINAEIGALQKKLMKHKQQKGEFIRAGLQAEGANLFAALENEKIKQANAKREQEASQQNDSPTVSEPSKAKEPDESVKREVPGGPEKQSDVPKEEGEVISKKEYDENQKKKAEENLKDLKEQLDNDNQITLMIDPFSKATIDFVNKVFSNLWKAGKRTFKEVVKFFKDRTNSAIYRQWRKFTDALRRTEDDNILRRDLSLNEAFRVKLQDKYVILDKIIKAMDPNGQSEGHMAYMKNELFRSKANNLRERMMEDIIGRDLSELGATMGDFKTKNSLRGRLLEFKGASWEQFDSFISAQHAQERNQRIREMFEHRRKMEIKEVEDAYDGLPKDAVYYDLIDDINEKYKPENAPEKGSGWTDTEAADFLDEISFENPELYDHYRTFAQEFRDKVVKGRIDLLREGGVISEETATQMKDGVRDGFKKFDFYVPMMVKPEFLPEDEFGIDKEHGINPNLKKLIGTDKYDKEQRYSSIEAALSYYFHAALLSEKNKALNELASFVANNADPNWELVQSRREVVVNDLGEIVQVKDFISDYVKQNSIAFRVDGKDAFIHIKPIKDANGVPVAHPLIRAFKNRNYDPNKFRDTVLEVARGFNNVRRAMITTLSPKFAITNLTRDIQDALTNLGLVSDSNSKRIKRNVARNIASAIPVLASAPWKKSGGLTKRQKRLMESWHKAQEYGVTMSWKNYEGLDTEIEELQKALDSIEKGLTTKTVIKGIYNRLTYLSDTLENVTRLSVFDAISNEAISRGIEPDAAYTQAAFAAKNVTLNFEKKGEWGASINALFLFANAGIQGARMTLKAMSNPKTLGFMALVTGLAAGNRELLYMNMDEDDWENYLYSEFTNAQKTMVMNPFDPQNPIQIPKSYGAMRFFISLGEAISDLSHNSYTLRNRANYLTTQLVTTIDPIGGSGTGFTAFAPSMVQPIVQSMADEAWYGGNVRNYYDDPTLDDAFEQNATTLGEEFFGVEYTDMAQQLYKYSMGAIDVSPTSIQYVAEQYMSGVTKEISRAFDPDEESRGIPVLSAFYTDVEDKNFRQIVTNVINLADRKNSATYTDKEWDYMFDNMDKVARVLSGSSLRNMILDIVSNRGDFPEKYKKQADEWLVKSRVKQAQKELRK